MSTSPQFQSFRATMEHFNKASEQSNINSHQTHI